MNYQGHLFVGLIAFIITYYFVKIPSLLILPALAVCLLFSLLPDIDQASSKIQNLFEGSVGGVGLLLLYLFFLHNNTDYLIYLACLLVILIIINFLKHRTIMHTIKAGLILSAVLFYVNKALFFYAIAGYLSHLAADKSLKW